MPSAPHGGADGTAFVGLDFSVNSNPFGPNPALLAAARGADMGVYPDPDLTEVRACLAAWHGVSPAEVVPALGASALLGRLAWAYLRPGDRVLSLGPAFGEFVRAVALTRARLDVAQPGMAGTLIAALKPTLVYLSRPNNPLGTSLPWRELRDLADACQGVGALLILDEAYAPLAPGLPTLKRHAAVVRLHSPGKVHGAVGLRLAYALAPPMVAHALRNLAPAWDLPAPTVAALLALPRAGAFVDETLPRWQGAADELATQLAEFVPVHPTGLPFFTLEVGNAARVGAALLARGLRARDCASYGFPARLRVSARTPPENAALLSALRDVTRG